MNFTDIYRTFHSTTMKYTFFSPPHDQRVYKKCSMTPIIKEIKIKSIMSYHLTLLGWLLSEGQMITSVDEDVEKRELLDSLDGNVNRYSHEKQY